MGNADVGKANDGVGRRRVKIADMPGFAGVLKDLVRREFGGSVNAAHEDLGVPLVTMQRLLSGEKREVSPNTLAALKAGLRDYFQRKAEPEREKLRALTRRQGQALERDEFFEAQWQRMDRARKLRLLQRAGKEIPAGIADDDVVPVEELRAADRERLESRIRLIEKGWIARYWERLERTFYGGHGRDLLDDYKHWKRQRHERSMGMRPARPHRTPDEESETSAAITRQIDAQLLEEDLDRRYDECLATFRRDMDAFEHERDRIDLAVFRILEPLLDASLSGGIERDWRDIVAKPSSARRLHTFLKQGIERERFMLDRLPAERRVAEVLDKDFPDPYERLFQPAVLLSPPDE